MKAIIYNRHSQDSGTGVSEEIQDPQMKALVEARGGVVVKALPSDDWSSFTLDRPSFKKARAMLNAGDADTLIVPALSRITRRLWHWEELRNEMREHGWTVIPLDMPVLDLSTDMGNTMAQYQIVQAEGEYRAKKKSLDEMRENATLRHGIHHGATPPWGFSGWSTRGTAKGGKALRGPLVPAKDNRVREAFEDAAAGISYPAFRRKYGAKMNNVVTNRVYLGEAKSGKAVNANHDGSLDSEGLGRTHPALVSEDLFRRANRRFKRAETGAGRPAKVKVSPAMLGGGVLRCGSCGHALTRQKSKRGDHYRCVWTGQGNTPGCEKRVSISCVSIEPYVLAAAIAMHAEDTALHVADAGSFDLAALGKALDAARADVVEVERMHAAGELSPVAYAGARTAADNAMLAAEVALSNGETLSGWRSVPAARVREKIANDVEAQRSLVADFLRVHVMPFPGKRVPVEERVALSRRTGGLPGAAVGNGTGPVVPLEVVAEKVA